MEFEDQLNPSMKKLQSVLEVLAFYHDHKINNPELLPRKGAALLLTNHSLATYDGFLLGMAVFKEAGRLVKGLGDDLLFKIPGVGEFCRDLGIYPASHKNAHKLIDDGEIIGIAPGGMRESLRPQQQRYKVYWGKRKGFARLSYDTHTPIYLAACPRGDDIFTVYENPLTAMMYRTFKVPLPIFKGWGPTLLPRPVKLSHTIAGPFYPPEETKNPSLARRAVSDFQRKMVLEMNKLMSACRND